MTPTPWMVAKFHMHILPKNGSGAICKFESIHGMYENYEANAAFICKAVNAHDTLVTELKLIADWRNVNLAGEYEHSLRDIIRSMLDCADRALATLKEPT